MFVCIGLCMCVARSKILIRMSWTQMLGSNTIPHNQEAGLLPEMAYPKLKERGSCYAIKLKSAKKKNGGDMSRGHKSQPEGVSLAKSRTI